MPLRKCEKLYFLRQLRSRALMAFERLCFLRHSRSSTFWDNWDVVRAVVLWAREVERPRCSDLERSVTATIEDHILGAVRQKIIGFKTHSSFFSVCCTQLFIVRKSNYGEETPKQKTSSKIGWKSGEVRRCNVTLTHWLTLKARPNARRIST